MKEINIYAGAKVLDDRQIIELSTSPEATAVGWEKILASLSVGLKIRYTTPPWGILLPEQISHGNYYERRRLIEHKEGKYPLVSEATGIVVDSQTGGLLPIIPANIKDTAGQPTATLCHIGLISPRWIENEEKNQPAKLDPFDNLHNMYKFGVFGSPDPKHLTYVRPPGSQASGMSRTATVIIFEINLVRLPPKWPIYHNIEMWKDWTKTGEPVPGWAIHDVPYAAYAISGGIPVIAVEKIEIGHIEKY